MLGSLDSERACELGSNVASRSGDVCEAPEEVQHRDLAGDFSRETEAQPIFELTASDDL